MFRRAPDPRDKHTRYRIGPVLTLIALALLAGCRMNATAVQMFRQGVQTRLFRQVFEQLGSHLTV